LKRVLKLSFCNVLTIYEKKYPTNSWDNFYIHNKSKLYKRLKKQIFEDQGKICAYCEVKVHNKQRIEHINDKSNSTSTNNLHLDWNNLVGVCFGGSSPKSILYPTPENLSCDSYKEHKSISHKEFLNPLEIKAFPNLFQFEKKTGKLKANIENCKLVVIPNNSYLTTEKLVHNTIINLNLNCDRLMTDRDKIFREYNKEIKKARISNNKNIKTELAYKWFSQKYPSFFTTRRILLGKYAEDYLKENNYDG